MKSELKVAVNTNNPEPVYPCALKSFARHGGFIVLFSEACVGTVIHGGPGQGRALGSHLHSWAMDAFEPLAPGSTITITV